MAWLDSLWTRDGRALSRARSLLDQGLHDEALDALRPIEGDTADALRTEARQAAAARWLADAVEACTADQGDRMRKLLARARRYHEPGLDPLFRAADRTIRCHQIRQVAPEHWLRLLDAADDQRHPPNDAELGDDAPPPRHALFASLRTLAVPAAIWDRDPDAAPVSVERIERADRQQLRALVEPLSAAYPDDLSASIPRLGEEFVRAVLLIAAARPDLAALPLVELPESDPLVCFERARVAHLLGLPRLALTALQGFSTLVGGHRTIRRLNTGVFLAQMAVAVGEPERGLAVLDELPVRYLGRRPVVLYARLLLHSGRLDDAIALLDEHVARHPDHDDATSLLAEATDLRDGALDEPSELSAEVIRADTALMSDYAVAPPRVARPPAATPAVGGLAGPTSGDEV